MSSVNQIRSLVPIVSVNVDVTQIARATPAARARPNGRVERFCCVQKLHFDEHYIIAKNSSLRDSEVANLRRSQSSDRSMTECQLCLGATNDCAIEEVPTSARPTSITQQQALTPRCVDSTRMQQQAHSQLAKRLPTNRTRRSRGRRPKANATKRIEIANEKQRRNQQCQRHAIQHEKEKSTTSIDWSRTD
jgi:hypothetical protein